MMTSVNSTEICLDVGHIYLMKCKENVIYVSVQCHTLFMQAALSAAQSVA
jgi:hypothetical protein